MESTDRTGTSEPLISDDAILQNLNPEQSRAVQTTDGPLLILAGAGSGKTRVITRRVAWLIHHVGVEPWRILAITFTNKAANEMKERIADLVGIAHRGIWIGTFHAMMLRILRVHGHLLGYRPSFTIFDTADQKRVMRDVLERLGIGERALTPADALRRVSRYKNDDLSPSDISERDVSGVLNQQWARIYATYQAELMRHNALDFDDILTQTLRLFREYPDVLDRYQRRFTHILVDEYQDTNQVQYALVRMLAARHQNLCVVGDDDQSIYAFRGATVHNILDFEDDFPSCTTIRLEQNYRSTKTILSAANHIIRENTGRKPKTLWTAHATGDPIVLYRATDHIDEARFVASDIDRRLRAAGRDQRPEIAVLYRMNALSRNIEFALRERNLDYRIYGGTRFYDRAEIKDVTAYLSLIQSPDDDIAFRRIINQPRRGIGSVTIERVAELAGRNKISLLEACRIADQMPALSRMAGRLKGFAQWVDDRRRAMADDAMALPEFIASVETESGLIDHFEAAKRKGDVEAESRLQNLEELISDAMEFETRLEHESIDDMWEFAIDEAEADAFAHLTDRSLTGKVRLFLERAALYTDQDKDTETPPVSLMTIHSAKGLEFDVVYVIGAEEDIFPSIRALEEVDGIEEERRLAYVAVTRAKQSLIITSSVSRLLFGHTQYNAISRFVEDIPDSLTEKRGQYGQPSPWAKAFGMRTERATRREAPTPEPAYHAVRRVNKEPPKKKTTGGLKADRLAVGDAVRHASFGEGTIQKITKTGDDAILTIDFDGTTKRYMASQSALSPVE